MQQAQLEEIDLLDLDNVTGGASYGEACLAGAGVGAGIGAPLGVKGALVGAGVGCLAGMFTKLIAG
jgi:hypothetical protein